MTALRLLAVAACLLLPLAAAAQAPAGPDPGAPAPVGATDDSRREAKALGDLLQLANRAQATLAQMRMEVIRLTMKAGDKSPEDAAKIVDEVMMPDFRATEPALVALLYEGLAASFTAADLKSIREFFAAPLGQRWLHTMPALERQNLHQIQALLQKTFHELVEKHADELRARGLKF